MDKKTIAICGRTREKKLLDRALRNDHAALVAVYGRRRVGKTHLIREYLRPRADTYFEAIGTHKAGRTVQLTNFQEKLEEVFFSGRRIPSLATWRDAMRLLGDEVVRRAASHPRKPIVLFFDELPWMATHRAGLLPAIDYEWNSRLSQVSNLVWVMCGSAASFMLDRLINAKGGLHNRITHRIRLEPFRLREVQEFLSSRRTRRTQSQALELYMALGGVPHYLGLVPRGMSAAQAIGELCFDRSGPLSDEFDRLFASLFDQADGHERIVRAVAERREGVLRDELIAETALSSGGALNRRLSELEAAGFLGRFIPYGKRSKQSSWRLIDEFSLFHLKWMERAPKGALGGGGANYWSAKARSPRARAWAGYAFENICLKHTEELQHALAITGIPSEIGTWRYIPPRKSTERGAQIDLLFDREDGVINLCEIKYAENKFTLSKSYAKELENKINVFRAKTGTKKQILVTLLTTHGLKPSLWAEDLIDQVITADALFRDVA